MKVDDNVIEVSKSEESPNYLKLILYRDDIVVNFISGLRIVDDKEFFILIGMLAKLINEDNTKNLENDIVKEQVNISFSVKSNSEIVKLQYKGMCNPLDVNGDIVNRVKCLLKCLN